MKFSSAMHMIRFFLGAAALCLGGCASSDNPFDTTNRDMTPLDGAGERPNIRNRFPESRGGLPHSAADREDRDMTPAERMLQYQDTH